jgi:hypothetical protein
VTGSPRRGFATRSRPPASERLSSDTRAVVCLWRL